MGNYVTATPGELRDRGQLCAQHFITAFLQFGLRQWARLIKDYPQAHSSNSDPR